MASCHILVQTSHDLKNEKHSKVENSPKGKRSLFLLLGEMLGNAKHSSGGSSGQWKPYHPKAEELHSGWAETIKGDSDIWSKGDCDGLSKDVKIDSNGWAYNKKFDLGGWSNGEKIDTGGWSEGIESGGWSNEELGQHEKTVTIVKETQVPIPVEKRVNVPVYKEVPYPVHVKVPQPYPVEKTVYVPVKVKHPVPEVIHKPVPVEKIVRVPVEVSYESNLPGIIN